MQFSSSSVVFLLALVFFNGQQATAAVQDSGFVQSQAASIIQGEPHALDYVHSLDWESTGVYDSIKGLVTRLGGGVKNDDRKGAVKFTPRFYIMDGRAECHNPDGSIPEKLTVPCTTHCINHGRYCDPHFFGEWQHWTGSKSHGAHYVQGLEKLGRNGADQMVETLRRACIWEEYGKYEPEKYFAYHDLMVSTGCHARETPECLNDVIQNKLHLDARALHNLRTGNGCMKTFGIHDDVNNTMLETELANAQKFNEGDRNGDPSLFFDGELVTTTHWYPDAVLNAVCNAFPEDDKPHLCTFCLDYCLSKIGTERRHSDYEPQRVEKCMWYLDCDGGNYNHFNFANQYLTDKNLTQEAIVASRSDVDDATDSGPGDNANDADAVMGIIPSPPHDPAGFAIFVLAAMITAGGIVLALAALRVWRTKMIIERYIREQKKDIDNANQGEFHHDQEFFPDDSANALDWDLEPALQYSDMLGGGSQRPSGPPSNTAFLPKIT